VLTEVAINGKVDRLVPTQGNVIMGPPDSGPGTGMTPTNAMVVKFEGSATEKVVENHSLRRLQRRW